nr:MAG TPA: restriction alleviation protein [Caudoviricetes sp.]
MTNYSVTDIVMALEARYGVNTPTREELIAAASVLELKKRLEENPTIKPAEVLPCPLCGAKHTTRVRTKSPDGFVRFCKCGFAGYITPTNSKNGGRITASWNQAVLDFVETKYQPPEAREWLSCK